MQMKGFKEKCVICGREVDDGYYAYSEEVSLYIEELCTRLGVNSEELFVCTECMFECCSSCKKYDTCYKMPLDLSCRYPEHRVERAITLHDGHHK